MRVAHLTERMFAAIIGTDVQERMFLFFRPIPLTKLKEAVHMSKQDKTRSRDFNAEIILGPDATMGEKLKALRLSRKMTITALSRASGLSDRAIRYMENNERQPSVDAIRKLSAAFEISTDYFMDDNAFQSEVHKEEVLAQAKEKYGTRGMAQARRVYETARGLYAGGELDESERDAFRDLMMELFFETKEEAKKYTPRKYRTDEPAQ